jgi:type I restriction enzyme M protein
MTNAGKSLDVSALETWLWDAACQIRGEIDAPKFKDYILPLVFLKRLSDVFEDEVAGLGEQFGGKETAAKAVDADHQLVRFFIPLPARWSSIAKVTSGLGEHLTTAVRSVSRENPRLQGVIDVTDFNATAGGQRIVNDDRLASLVQVLGKYRLGLNDVEPDMLGTAYEYLLRKFAEGQGQSAGEFFTPPEVAKLMARILDPQPGESIYDPACGSGGLLIKTHLRLLEKHGVVQNGHRRLPKDIAPLQLFGQELNHATYAMARMNAFLHEMEAEIALGDTMARPAFLDQSGGLVQFDKVTANPMWNQNFPAASYEQDAYGRFSLGSPPASTADWGWVQHMYSSLREGGLGAVVLDTGAVSRGSGTSGRSKERDIRKRFVEEDRIEAVILMPENLFYNTSAPGIIMVFRRGPRQHKGEILLVNASKRFAKGKPKNYMTDDGIAEIGETIRHWRATDRLSAIIKTSDAVANDFNLSPSRYVATDGQEEVLPPDEAVVLLKEAEEERLAADAALGEALGLLGIKWGLPDA